MAYCKDRILKNLMTGKQMTVADMAKLFKQGKGTVKSALAELKREGYVAAVRYMPRPLGGPKTGVYAWTGKGINESPTLASGEVLCTQRILAALEREPMMSVSELSGESGYSVAFTRKTLHELHTLDKIRIAGWRPSRGTTMMLYGLANGEPDAAFVRPELTSKTLQNKRAKAEAERRPTVVKPRRDPAAAWF
jgi:predicted ArsR family transcriptional regulator